MIEFSHDQPHEILELGIDWVTATAKAGKGASVLGSRAEAIMSIREAEGYRRKPWRHPHYSGDTIDGCTFGTREADAMIRLSGDIARRYGPTIITFADNVSRLDVQVTLRDPNIANNWASKVHHLGGLFPRIQSGEITTRLIQRTPEGTTAYIGERVSDRMLRCYDKYAESDHDYPVGSWRWEVEYKKDRAQGVAKALQQRGYKPQMILDVVARAYASYDIRIPTVVVPTGWRDKGIKHTTDDERRLEWLARSIAPMLARMRESHQTEVLLSTLGFGDVIDTLEGLHQLLDLYERKGDGVGKNGYTEDGNAEVVIQ